MTLPSRQTALYFASFIATGMLLAALGPALSGFARQTGVAIGTIGIVFTAQALGLLLGTVVAGRGFDRWPAHPAMAIMVAIMVVAIVLVPFPQTLPLLLLAIFLFGVGKGGIDVASNTALVWVHGKGVGPFLNALHFCFGLGALIGPVLVAQVLDRTGKVDMAYWIMALALAPLPFLFWRTPGPRAPILVADAPEAAVRWLPVLVTAALFFLYVGLEAGFSGWIFTYATRLNLAATVAAGYLTSLFWASLTLGRLFTIPLATRVRPRYLLLANLLGILVFLGILAIWPQTPLVVWIVTVGLGLSMAGFYPTLLALAGRHLPLSGRVTSVFLVGGGLGAMILPWLVGRGFGAFGPQTLAPFLLLLALLALACFFVLLRVFRAMEQAQG